jgi:hypothetical protein
MDRFEIVVGGAYVKGQDGPFIRVVQDISEDGEVQWRDFERNDGEPIGSGRCSMYAFRNWAGRPATEEERRRLRWDRARRTDEEFVRSLIDRIPDDDLHEEHRRRDLAARYHEEILASEERLRELLRRVPDDEIVLEYQRRKLGRRR